MNTERYILFVCIAILLMFRASRNGALILTIDWVVYLIFILPLDVDYYYAATAGINTLVGLVLCKRYIGVAICSFLFIPVNYYGYMLWYNYQLPDSYDNISLYLSIIQLLLIIPKGTYSYVARRFSVKRPMVRAANFDSRDSCAKMHKSTQAKGENQ